MMTYRWQERERYDVMQDAQTVCFMAVTNKGTFFKELACGDGAQRRETRKLFRTHALALMEEGVNPCEVEIE